MYIDTFAVAEHVRNQGIGTKLYSHLRSLLPKREVCRVKLQTDKAIEAYKIYRHWGFQDSELVTMTAYVTSWD